MSDRCFILHAVNVHGGGGLTLLKSLVNVLPSRSKLILDERMPLSNDELSQFFVYRIKPTLWGRFKAELLLKRLALDSDTVLCFGNLPPMFRLRAKVLLFIQNRYLVEPSLLSSTAFKLRLRLTIEHFWLSFFQRNINEAVVQTPSMQALSCNYISAPVVIAPFVAKSNLDVDLTEASKCKEYNFIYVASGEPHKNHQRLLDAWVELARQGLYPSLCLTLNDKQFPRLVECFAIKKKQYNLRIDNQGLVVGNETLELYKHAEALIFPSTLESFGLPLIEAKNAGLKIVASELDYVRDILAPDESFDPQSAISIARAVKRLMKLELEKLDLLSAKEFITLLMGK